MFINTKIYFINKEKEKIILAKISNRLYIITHVTTRYKEKAFASFEALLKLGLLNTHRLVLVTAEILLELSLVNITNTKELYINSFTQKDKDFYKLIYYWLNHLRLEKIYTLYKVITFSYLIKILRSKEIYEVYKLIKIRNQILKTLSLYKEFKLALI